MPNPGELDNPHLLLAKTANPYIYCLKKQSQTEEDDVTYVNLYPASASVLEVRVFPSAPFVLGDARALLYSQKMHVLSLPITLDTSEFAMALHLSI